MTAKEAFLLWHAEKTNEQKIMQLLGSFKKLSSSFTRNEFEWLGKKYRIFSDWLIDSLDYNELTGHCIKEIVESHVVIMLKLIAFSIKSSKVSPSKTKYEDELLIFSLWAMELFSNSSVSGNYPKEYKRLLSSTVSNIRKHAYRYYEIFLNNQYGVDGESLEFFQTAIAGTSSIDEKVLWDFTTLNISSYMRMYANKLRSCKSIYSDIRKILQALRIIILLAKKEIDSEFKSNYMSYKSLVDKISEIDNSLNDLTSMDHSLFVDVKGKFVDNNINIPKRKIYNIKAYELGKIIQDNIIIIQKLVKKIEYININIHQARDRIETYKLQVVIDVLNSLSGSTSSEGSTGLYKINESKMEVKELIGEMINRKYCYNITNDVISNAKVLEHKEHSRNSTLTATVVKQNLIREFESQIKRLSYLEEQHGDANIPKEIYWFKSGIAILKKQEKEENYHAYRVCILNAALKVAIEQYDRSIAANRYVSYDDVVNLLLNQEMQSNDLKIGIKKKIKSILESSNFYIMKRIHKEHRLEQSIHFSLNIIEEKYNLISEQENKRNAGNETPIYVLSGLRNCVVAMRGLISEINRSFPSPLRLLLVDLLTIRLHKYEIEVELLSSIIEVEDEENAILLVGDYNSAAQINLESSYEIEEGTAKIVASWMNQRYMTSEIIQLSQKTSKISMYTRVLNTMLQLIYKGMGIVLILIQYLFVGNINSSTDELGSQLYLGFIGLQIFIMMLLYLPPRKLFVGNIKRHDLLMPSILSAVFIAVFQAFATDEVWAISYFGHPIVQAIMIVGLLILGFIIINDKVVGEINNISKKGKEIEKYRIKLTSGWKRALGIFNMGIWQSYVIVSLMSILTSSVMQKRFQEDILVSEFNWFGFGAFFPDISMQYNISSTYYLSIFPYSILLITVEVFFLGAVLQTLINKRSK